MAPKLTRTLGQCQKVFEPKFFFESLLVCDYIAMTSRLLLGHRKPVIQYIRKTV